jgi:alkylhydroperoxidase family enzyme
MGSLTVKVQLRLSKEDAALLARVAKARRSGQSSIVREALMEWFARKGFLNEDERAALGFAGETPVSGSRLRLTAHSSDTQWSP